MTFVGSELFHDKSSSAIERIYCGLLGMPIVGLRIRVRRLKLLLPDKATTILDAGCGRGVITRFLAKRYSSAIVDGVDSSHQRQDWNTALSGKIGLRNCTYISQDLLHYQRPDYYDLIISVDNLEHIENDHAVLANFFISMKEGGTLLVHVPHYYRRWPVFSWRRNFDVPGHVRPGYHIAEIKERVSKSGFQVVAYGFSYGFMENIANNASYAITRAEERNKIIYALFFPVLNTISWLGQWSDPKMGAGVWVRAIKSKKQ